MKVLALALGLSVALHLGFVVLLPPSPPAGERVGVRGGGDGFVSFTPVLVESKPEVKVTARAMPRRAVAITVAAEGPAVPMEVAAEEGAAAVVPHPPGGEGARALAPAPIPVPDNVPALVHARLAAMADRCYPAAARRYQQRGTVQLSFCTNAQGGASSSEVTQSSGAALLDAAARGCVVENAAPFPPEAASRCFTVPIRFGERHD